MGALRRLVAGIVVAVGCTGVLGSGSSFGTQQHRGAVTWSSLPTLSQLEGELSVSYSQSTVPQSLVPKLGVFQVGLRTSQLYGQKGCGQVGSDLTDIRSEVPCTFGDRTAARSVLVIGDSQAGMWIPTFDTWGIKEHWKVYRLMKLACTPWTDPTTWPNCDAWRKFVVKEILLLKPTVVVATAMEETKQHDSISVTPAKMESYILGFVSEISKAHAKVFVMQSLPWFFSQGDPDTCLASYPTDVEKCNHDSPQSVLASSMQQGVSLAATTGKVSALDVDQLFCTERACPVLVGKYNLYYDEWHFQEPWGRYIARAFSQVFTP
jgi:hypothetical protein